MPACSQEPAAPTKLGVFAETPTGFIELATYAEPAQNGNYSFPNLRHSPSSQSIRAFYINRPNLAITNAKVFGVADVRFTIHADRQPPLPIQTACPAPDSYKIKCPNLSRQQAGFGLLKITPPNAAERMYVIKLGD